VAGSSKRLASRLYQLKADHCLTGQYLKWKGNKPTAKCWWCPVQDPMREHLFKCCPHWKRQQIILWAEERRETGRGEDRFRIRDLTADARTSQAVLDFLSTTDVGRRAPASAEEDKQSDPSQCELRERRERKEGEEVGAEGEGQPLFLPTPSFMVSAGEEQGDWGRISFAFPLPFLL